MARNKTPAAWIGTPVAGNSAVSRGRGSPKPPGPGPPPESLSPWLILKGEVKETTWVSIRVDGNEPKEYMFQPGAKPQWKGRRGFEIIIGNAAGMDLDLDGKSMETWVGRVRSFDCGCRDLLNQA
jgi:hypothetical protein